MTTTGPSLVAFAKAACASAQVDKLEPWRTLRSRCGCQFNWCAAYASGHNAPRVPGGVLYPATRTAHPAAMRTRSPQPLGHNVQKDCFTSTGPRAACGIHGQFWLQIETSSNTFQGTGVATMPAAAPAL